MDSLITLKVDTSPFVISSEPDIITEDDSGISDSDNITSVRNPRFRNLLEEDRQFNSSFITNSGGSTSLSKALVRNALDVVDTLQVPTNLTSGNYSFKYKVIDLAGNESSLVIVLL